MSTADPTRGDGWNLAAFAAALVTWLLAAAAGVTVGVVAIVRDLTGPDPQTTLAGVTLILAAVATVAFMATITLAVRAPDQ